MFGPQPGTGRVDVADWWLGSACVVEDENEAAAAPATTTDSAKMRMASFISSNLFWLSIDRRRVSLHTGMVVDFLI